MRKALALVLLLASACSSDRIISAQRVVATPVPPPPTRAPTPAPTPQPTPAAVANAGVRDDVQTVLAAPVETMEVFRGLESWIDVFDHTDDPATVLPLVQGMAGRGVKTLYLETARYGSAADIQYPTAVGVALDEAKALGMRVVAWYPPGFADLERDVRRSLTAINFVSPRGNRFDAFGADIEYTTPVPDHAERSRLAVEYSRQLRAHAGGSYPMAAIVIPPSFLAHRPDRWPAFPWAELRALYDVFMPMNYWTAFGKNPQTAAEQTQRDTGEVRRLTGRPVHTIGGLGESADEAQVAAYVAAALESGSIGGGLYDYATTRPEVWDELQALNG
jgi:hypothetical protein